MRGYMTEPEVCELWRFMGRTDQLPKRATTIRFGEVHLDAWKRKKLYHGGGLRNVNRADLMKMIDRVRQIRPEEEWGAALLYYEGLSMQRLARIMRVKQSVVLQHIYSFCRIMRKL
jgi:hypothetical protein